MPDSLLKEKETLRSIALFSELSIDELRKISSLLFGVYGMLGIGLMLFTLRGLRPDLEWNEKPIKWSFWMINIGLFTMVTFSLLPVGLMQTYASVKDGYWYARSAEFLQTDLMQTLRWLRAFGDTIFALGAVLLVYFVFSLSLKFKNRN